MNKYIVVNGYPRAGKDLFVDYCCQALQQATPMTLAGHKISSVDAVKKAALLLGWDGNKDAKGRAFLSALKDLSTEAYDGPLDYMLSKISELENKLVVGNFYFFFIREPEEILKFIQIHPGTITVRVSGKYEKCDFLNTGDSRISNFDYDHTILNYGTKSDLQCAAISFITNILEASCR